jgi:hypothetical protein
VERLVAAVVAATLAAGGSVYAYELMSEAGEAVQAQHVELWESYAEQLSELVASVEGDVSQQP